MFASRVWIVTCTVPSSCGLFFSHVHHDSFDIDTILTPQVAASFRQSKLVRVHVGEETVGEEFANHLRRSSGQFTSLVQGHPSILRSGMRDGEVRQTTS